MSTRRLWTLSMVGEPEPGGVPLVQVRTTAEAHDDPAIRSVIEDKAHRDFTRVHKGHVIVSEWWAFEDMEVRD